MQLQLPSEDIRGFHFDSDFLFCFRIVDISGPDGGDFLSIVRLSRVLRPLRAINRVPSKFFSFVVVYSFQFESACR